MSHIKRKEVSCKSSDRVNQLFLIALLICGRMCVTEGAGVHQWNLPMHNYIGVLYVQFLVRRYSNCGLIVG